MDRTQKWMGSVGCLGQIENIKRQSLLSSNDDLSVVKQAGLLIDGIRWSIYNAGSTSTTSYDSGYQYASAKVMCPSGWRLPTEKELNSLISNYSAWTTYKGIAGRWLSGTNPYSPNVNRIFCPAILTLDTSSKTAGYYWTSVMS